MQNAIQMMDNVFVECMKVTVLKDDIKDVIKGNRVKRKSDHIREVFVLLEREVLEEKKKVDFVSPKKYQYPFRFEEKIVKLFVTRCIFLSLVHKQFKDLSWSFARSYKSMNESQF